MFDEILIATDNSPLIRNAIEYTANLFPYSEFHLINVVNTSDGSIPQTKLMKSRLTDISAEALEEGEKILNNMGIDDVKKAMPEGTPSKEILGYVNNNKIDLLVMATHSTSGSQKVHIGETAINSLQVTNIPTLIFAREVDVKVPDKIFNPTTFSSYSVDATMLALSLAEYTGASLTTYHIGKSDPGASARRIEKRAKKDKIDYRIIENRNATDEEIIKMSQKFDFMIGSRGRSGILYKLKSIFPRFSLSNIEKELLAESKIPFLMVGD